MRSVLELIILGILKKEKKLHGYRIKKRISERISPLVSFQSTSIYYTLKKLKEEGFVEQHKEPGERGRERIAYSITKKGERKLRRLIIENILLAERPFFNMDIAILFLDELPRKKKLSLLLKKRLLFLKEALKWVENSLKSDKLKDEEKLVKDHMKRALQEEIRFTEELASFFRSDAKRSCQDS